MRYNAYGSGRDYWNYFETRSIIHQCLYHLISWPHLAEELADVIKPTRGISLLDGSIERVLSRLGNLTKHNMHGWYGRRFASSGDDDALIGIECGDQQPRAAVIQELIPTIRQLHNTSRLAGDALLTQTLAYAQWPAHARERPPQYLEHIPVAKPVLILGNDGDPITFVRSAYNISASFTNSAVVELVEAYGHTSISTPSSCAAKAMQAYWVNGTLPSNRTKCEVESKPFALISWSDILRKIAQNARS